MLIEFKVSNYRSIAEEQIISFVPASNQKNYPDNIITSGKYKSLNAIALYGANASGKSNILKAMDLLHNLLATSAQLNSTAKLPYEPFLLKESYKNKPTKLEITFILNESRYRYIVEYNRTNILAEYLYRKNLGREVVLFERENGVIEVSKAFKGSKKIIDAAIEATKDNSLFLSTCDMLNVSEAKEFFKWFHSVAFVDGANYLNGIKEGFVSAYAWDENPVFREKIKQYLLLLNLGFVDLDIKKINYDGREIPKEMPENIRNTIVDTLKDNQTYEVLVKHHTYDEINNKTDKTISWELDNESQGTQRAFQLSAYVGNILFEGGILIIDEIEAKMHPIMTINTLNLFLNKETNPKNAQIIFTTHDTNLLTYTDLRRDQINFVEKNQWEATEVYSLSDFKYFNEKERIDTDKEKRYMEGRYGAIPILSDFSKKFKPEIDKQNINK